MTIPSFNEEGRLPKGIHICSGDEFLARFCHAGSRKQFVKPISDIFDFAKEKNARHLFVGGSFVSINADPSDFDCVMVFTEDRFIPTSTERVAIAGLKFDILYASLENSNIVDSYIKLFSSDRSGRTDIGIIEVDLYAEKQVWIVKHVPDDTTFEIIKRVYNDRKLIDINAKMGILVTVHGLMSRAEWNMDIMPIASNQGWIVAPYIYDTNKPDLLFNKSKRSKVVDEFRDWIYGIQQKYNAEVSVIAHSFGTFIVGSYIAGFDEKEFPPVSFNGVVLTGSILNCNFDWEKHKGVGLGRVYNMIAPNDEYIKYMPESELTRYIGMSPLFGRAGVDGFSQKTQILSQSTNQIFTHSNTIKPDIIETKWMPFLNANKDIMTREVLEYFKRRYGGGRNMNNL